ncbi:MAG TPA: ABC transporter permease subunit [Candidatus Paceibacterota bacterium]|nr:ABC transporter permease subunit [Candidatus Paceibacterota bacterium]
MTNIWVIAKNTFRSALRDKILYAVLGFGVLYILFTIFLSVISLDDLQMTKNFGLAGLYVFGLIIAIFLGTSVLAKEVSDRTLYFVLSKPVSRSQVIIGKWLGIFLAVSVTVLIMAAVYLGVIWNRGGGFDAWSLLAVLFELMEIGFFVALTIFFSTISTSLASVMEAAVVLFMGHAVSALLESAEKQGISGLGYRALQLIYYVFPNLEKFNLRNLVVYQMGISWSAAGATVAYAICYSALLLWAAIAIFRKREL